MSNSKVEFEDSAEATDFMVTIQAMLNDPRLKNWAKVTEENYFGEFKAQLSTAQFMYDEFLNAMFKAE